ncbi:MAG TPA: hypothetical protein VF472_12845 [Burkholderiaceae bacterium]
MKLQAIYAALLAGGISVASICHAQSSYQFVDLGNGTAAGINDRGQIVGSSSLGATLWQSGATVALSLGADGYATAINNAGQIVGATVAHGVPEAALWFGNTLASLNGTGSGITYANCINGSGQIGGGDGVATLWNGKDPTDLGMSNGYSVAANGINNSGMIVGNATVYTDGATVATSWESRNGGATVLQGLGGNYSDAYAVNNSGIVVGTANTAASGNTFMAMEWSGGKATTLASLGGSKSYAFAINDAREIVGSSTDAAGTPYATLWNGKSVVNLNSLLNPALAQEGWVLTVATGINSEGWIVGNAVNAKLGESDAFLLKTVDPVPEAGSPAMLAAGLCLIGAAAWLRRRAAASSAMPS